MSQSQHKSFQELPKMHNTYAAVIKSLIPSLEQSVKPHELPSAIYEVPKLVIDQANLAEYRKVCGFINDGRVPATYYAVLSQTLQMNMMAKDDFPFAMLGLIHLYNRVEQYRPIFDTEVVKLSVQLGNLRAHDKGQQFDFVTQVSVDDILVWQGVSTYLSRQKIKKDGQDKPAKADTPAKLTLNPDGFSQLIFVEEDIGRRYAFVSGDFNLIHLHPLSAKAFGYPKAIAHGMWSQAKVLSLFKKLPERFCCEVSFKAPIFLPSQVELIANPSHTEGTYSHHTLTRWQFGVYAKNSDKPHLLGTLHEL